MEYSLNISQGHACFSTFPRLNISRPGGETWFCEDFRGVFLFFFAVAVKGEEGARQESTTASNKLDEATYAFEVGLRNPPVPPSPRPPFTPP